jgi:D-amino-acid oxidase
MIDNDHSIGWLRRQVQAAGVTITQRRIDGRLSEQEDRLRAEFRADAIVNNGLGRCPDPRTAMSRCAARSCERSTTPAGCRRSTKSTVSHPEA